MATTAQILANRANAAHSTGPKTEAGKAAVAQNSVTHGLAGAFRLLPTENEAEFNTLLETLAAEHAPETHTEQFLVREMAHAEWRLRRVAALEAEILSKANPTGETNVPDALLKLNRYEQSARRAWYNALNQLRNMRLTDESADRRRHALSQARMQRVLEETIFAPVPMARPEVENRIHEAKPLPIHLQREMESLRRRNPDFDPELDRSQMTGELQRWYDRHVAKAA